MRRTSAPTISTHKETTPTETARRTSCPFPCVPRILSAGHVMVTPRFAVDKMLGRLATWLRLVGYYTTYGSHLAGSSLIRHARAEDRTILTRDHRVLRAARALSVIFIASNDFRQQLRQVIDTNHLDPFAELFSRCTTCNTPMVALLKAEVVDNVPPYVFAAQQRFARCPSCRRIYWKGTHFDRVREQLRLMGYQGPSRD